MIVMNVLETVMIVQFRFLMRLWIVRSNVVVMPLLVIIFMITMVMDLGATRHLVVVLGAIGEGSGSKVSPGDGSGSKAPSGDGSGSSTSSISTPSLAANSRHIEIWFSRVND